MVHDESQQFTAVHARSLWLLSVFILLDNVAVAREPEMTSVIKVVINKPSHGQQLHYLFHCWTLRMMGLPAA